MRVQKCEWCNRNCDLFSPIENLEGGRGIYLPNPRQIWQLLVESDIRLGKVV